MILRRCFLIAAMALVCVQCSAAQSNDSDTFAAGNDSRLQQKVTFGADGSSLSSLLDDLSTKTSVTMNAGQNADDWSVRDRKIIVHVTDMKLVDLMQYMASTLHFHWSRSGEAAKSVYRLWQDRNERDEEESLRASEDSTKSREARDKRENGLADMVNLGSLSGADADKLMSSDPWRYVLATEPLGRDVADFLSQFPEARNSFVQGTDASFPVLALPTELQGTVRRIAESYDSLMKSIGDSEDHSALLGKFDKLQITINRRIPGATGTDIVSKSMLGRITIGSGMDSFDIPLFDPASPMGKALGKAIIGLKNGVPKEQIGKQLEADMKSAVQVSEASTQAAPRDITSDPALRAKIKLFDGASTVALPVVLKALAEQTKLNVISDYFPSPAPAVEGGEKTIGEQLEVIRKAYGSNWTKSGGVLVFRDKDWFTKRAWCVPEVWMKYWADKGKINNGLLFDDLLRIADLRDEQIDHSIMSDPQLLRYGAGEAARNRQILRFYVSLTPDQRTLMSDSKLAVGSLSDDEWAALKVALATKGAAYAAVQRENQFIQLAQSGADVIEYKFAYYPNGTDAAVIFKVSTGDAYKTPDEVAIPPTPKPKSD